MVIGWLHGRSMAGVSGIGGIWADGIGINSVGSGKAGGEGSSGGIANEVFCFPFCVKVVFKVVNNTKNGLEIGSRAESLKKLRER